MILSSNLRCFWITVFGICHRGKDLYMTLWWAHPGFPLQASSWGTLCRYQSRGLVQAATRDWCPRLASAIVHSILIYLTSPSLLSAMCLAARVLRCVGFYVFCFFLCLSFFFHLLVHCACCALTITLCFLIALCSIVFVPCP